MEQKTLGSRCAIEAMRLLGLWFWVAKSNCLVPDVRRSAPAGACWELVVPDGGRCTPRCASGYTASETSLVCEAGQLTPSTFRCEPCESKIAPFELSRCMDDISACGEQAIYESCCPNFLLWNWTIAFCTSCPGQRLQYATHLAQAGDWEGRIRLGRNATLPSLQEMRSTRCL